MTEIVLAVDDSEQRARVQAEQIANLDLAAATVTIIHVFSRNEEGASVSQVGSARAARRLLEDAGIDVKLAERSGDAADEIISLAEEEVGADLISVSGRKRTPAGKAVFGSVSQSVMLNTDLPVLFCPSEPEGR